MAGLERTRGNDLMDLRRESLALSTAISDRTQEELIRPLHAVLRRAERPMEWSSAAKKTPPRGAASMVARERLRVLDQAKALWAVDEACRLRIGTRVREGERRSDPERVRPQRRVSDLCGPPHRRVEKVGLERPVGGCDRHEALEAPRVSAISIRLILHARHWSE